MLARAAKPHSVARASETKPPVGQSRGERKSQGEQTPARLWTFAGTPPRVQRKPVIGAVDDPAEREADRVADAVMRMPERGVAPGASGAQPTAPTSATSRPRVQRLCAACGEEVEGTVRRLCAHCEAEQHGKEQTGGAAAAPSGFEQRLAALPVQPMRASE